MDFGLGVVVGAIAVIIFVVIVVRNLLFDFWSHF